MYVGVDAGTSVTKAAAFGDDGRVLAVESAQTRLLNPEPGRYEQDQEEVLVSLGDVVRAVCAAAGGEPELLAVTGQGDGVWLADDRGRPVRPAVSWMDSRAAAFVEGWQRDGVAERVYRRSGSTMFPGCSASILAHLDRAEPASLDAATTAAYCKDMLMQRLTGLRATDCSDASLPFLDPHTRTYADDLLSACGLAHRRELLAPVATSGPVAELDAGGAAVTGLAAGTPVVAAPFDLPACAAGAGVTGAGDGLLTIGTTLACQVVTDTVDTSGEPAGMTLATWRHGRWLRAMPAMVGTASLDWVLGTLGVSHDVLDEVLAGSPPGAHGVEVLPFFSPAGERAPFVEPAARAQFSGISLQTSRADLVRATCEAIAFAARHCLEAAGLTGSLAVCGGGVNSRPWLQIFADVLRRPLRIAPRPEVGARGAVVSGLAATGREPDPDTWTAPEGVVEPRDGVASYYEERYAAYLKQVQTARNSWRPVS